MGFLPFDLKKLAILASLIAIPLLSINIQHKEEKIQWFIKPVYIVTGFLQGIYTGFSTGVKDTTGLYLNLVHIKKNNRELTEKIKFLESTLSQFDEVKAENKRLKGLLDFKGEAPHALISARVIGHDLLGQHSTIFIDKGSDDGVIEGHAVITPDGVVGTVLTVEKNFSQILTLIDRYSDIDAVIERSRARGVIEGISPSLCRLKYLQRTDDVEVGDLVVTTGLDHIFPQGFPIGKVTYVEKKNYGITQEVHIEPHVASFDIAEVFVVIKPNDRALINDKIKDMSKKD